MREAIVRVNKPSFFNLLPLHFKNSENLRIYDVIKLLLINFTFPNLKNILFNPLYFNCHLEEVCISILLFYINLLLFYILPILTIPHLYKTSAHIVYVCYSWESDFYIYIFCNCKYILYSIWMVTIDS